MMSLWGWWYVNDLQSTPSTRDIKIFSATDLDVRDRNNSRVGFHKDHPLVQLSS